MEMLSEPKEMNRYQAAAGSSRKFPLSIVTVGVQIFPKNPIHKASPPAGSQDEVYLGLFEWRIIHPDL